MKRELQFEQPARIVIVDDDRLNREIARDALQGQHRVETCANAVAALEALTREPADLVISDLTMPGLSGIELLERVRREHPGAAFVLVTANASVESAVGALRMGAADYLLKPIQPEELQLVVDRILARSRLLQENERLRDALRTVDACGTLARCLDASEVYTIALDLLTHSLPRERGIALFRRTSVPMSDGVAFRGFGEGEARDLRDRLMGEKPVDLDTIGGIDQVSESAMHDALRAAGLRSERALVIPIRGRESEVGAVWLFEDGRPFDPGEVERAMLIAGHAYLALANAERFSEAKERAFIDDTTDAYNARYLLRATENEIQRAERSGQPLTVLFLDLDRFKRVNDQYGHLVGSQVLRQLADVLQHCIRQIDTLARYGGDEFTILLLDTDHTRGMEVGDRIRRIVADTVFEGARDAPIRLSISIGVATYPAHCQERDSLLDLADKAMYRAKSLGRNCVCSADDLSS